MSNGIFEGAENMIVVVVVAMLVVLLAMMLDLVSGLYKAKLRGDTRSSWCLKRTLTKFITYEGGMLIAAGVDLLIHLSKLVYLFGLNVIAGVPVITCIVGVFLLVVEFISMRENADQKTKKEMVNTAELLVKMLQNDNLKELFEIAIEQHNKEKEAAQ